MNNILLLNYKSILKNADNYILQFLEKNDPKLLLIVIKEYKALLESVDITDYLLIDSENKYIPKNVYIESYYKLGTFYKTLAELEINKKGKMDDYEEKIFKNAINCFLTVLRIVFEHDTSILQLVSIYSQLTFHSQSNIEKALIYLQESLIYAPDNPNINYNLGFLYQKLNKLELSIIHFKLGIYTNKEIKNLQEQMETYINCYNGLSSVYRSIKQWPESLFYLKKAHDINKEEPNINNQLGVVYTEMRRTDLANIHYMLAIKYYTKSILKTNPDILLSEIYLNMGHMYSYNGKNNDSINCYNNSLKINPTFLLPFQNKIFNLCYMYNDLEPGYIFKQHKNINKLLKNKKVKCNIEKYNNKKIHIGIVSSDLIDHPVSFFIKTFLEFYDCDIFNVYCYSDVILDTNRILNKNINIRYFRHKTTKECCDIIQNDKIDILFDLAGHTAFNRIDVFASKPANIQISYIGYPYTTGLHEIDYRITDNYCDNLESQKEYTEKLLFLPECFLCYYLPNTLPELTKQPYLENNYITFGCFNRLNKINDNVTTLYNKILINIPNCNIIIKNIF